jgi:hypothetical protein
MVSNKKEDKKMNQGKISYGYDRHVKSWCVLVYPDDVGCAIKSCYVYSKREALLIVKDFKKDFGIEKVEKVRAY